MWSSHRADTIECIAHIGHPVTQRIIHRILQRPPTRGHGDHFGAQQAHAEHVGGLTTHVMRAHVDDAFQTEFGTDRGSGNPMLASTGFCDDPGLAHAARQQDLSEHIVDLMRAGVVQLVALQIDLGATQMLGQALCKIEWAWPAHVVFPQIVHLGPEFRVHLGLLIFFFEAQDQRHQRFADKATAKYAETTIFVRPVHETVDEIFGHGWCLRLPYALVLKRI